MAGIRPVDLPTGTPTTDAALIFDSGASVQKCAPIDLMNAARPLATQAQAEAGTDNVAVMSSLRVAQAIDAQGMNPADLAAPAGASLVGFIQAGTGAAGRTAQDKMREPVSVLDFGAVGDGTTDDTVAFQRAYNAASVGQTILIPATGSNYIVGSLTGTKQVIWRADFDATNDTLILGLPGIVLTSLGESIFIRRDFCTANDYAVFRIDRNAKFSGGNATTVNSAIVVNSNPGANVASAEWGITSSLINNATAGNNTAIYAQGKKASTGPTWALTSEARDISGIIDPTNGLIGAEIDIFANGTDRNNTRVGIDLVIGRGEMGGTQCEAGYGLRIGSFNGASSEGRVKTAASLYNIDCDSGFDTTLATFSTGGPAFRMAETQYLSFTETNDRWIKYNNGPVVIGKGSQSSPVHMMQIWDDGHTYSPATPVGALSSPAIGARHFVTDATATTFGTIVAGGGANKVPVYSDGTNWRIG